MDVAELDYTLPEELIAQRPAERRGAARLLVLDRVDGSLAHRSVQDLPELVRPALWVVNDTRVIPARLLAHKETGGKVELLLLERASPPGDVERWVAMGRASKPLRAGAELTILPRSGEVAPERAGRLFARVLERGADGRLELELRAAGGVEAALEWAGHVPLPPYIRRPPEAADRARYQTVFAERPGAVAAPTAGLHFDRELLDRMEAMGHRFARVTLHVGPGTFRPVKTLRLEDHPMHVERYVVSESTARAIEEARRDETPVIAVGTTVVRTLESAFDGDAVRAGEGATDLFVRPPYVFRAFDGLLTNFHLPRSTLLALVMAFAGVHSTRRAYAEAVAHRYRFFSYGDAMLIRDERVCP